MDSNILKESVSILDGKYSVTRGGGIYSLLYDEPYLLRSYKSLNRPIVVRLNGKQYQVRRLVAEHFVPNPENMNCVAHLDGNRDNCEASNLKWVSFRETLLSRKPKSPALRLKSISVACDELREHFKKGHILVKHNWRAPGTTEYRTLKHAAGDNRTLVRNFIHKVAPVLSRDKKALNATWSIKQP
jgi:hypothetical protein